MINKFCRLMIVCGLWFCVAAQASQLIAFERKGFIWTAQINGSHSKKIIKGSWPTISPSGKYIAFNTDESSAKTVIRRLATINIETNKIIRLKNVSSDNSFNPKWSLDNSRLLFNTFANGHWHIAVINADNTHYNLIKNTTDIFQPTWAIDGKSFFCHDLTFIYWLDLDGKCIKKWDIHAVFPHGEMNSASRLDASLNGKWLIMDVDLLDEKLIPKGEDRELSTIWMLEIASGKATRLLAQRAFGSNPCWINENEFLFTQAGKKSSLLYGGAINEEAGHFILANVWLPSVSRVIS